MSVRLSQGRRRAPKVCAALLSVVGSSGQMCLSLVSRVVAPRSLFKNPPHSHPQHPRSTRNLEQSTIGVRTLPRTRLSRDSSHCSVGSCLPREAFLVSPLLASADFFVHLRLHVALPSKLSLLVQGRVLCYICQMRPHILCNAFSIVIFFFHALYTGCEAVFI